MREARACMSSAKGLAWQWNCVGTKKELQLKQAKGVAQ